MSEMWTEALERLPRHERLNKEGTSFNAPRDVRQGDLWDNASAGQNTKMLVELVTKYVDPSQEAIWYIIIFANPNDATPPIKGLNISDGLGIGTFYVGKPYSSMQKCIDEVRHAQTKAFNMLDKA